MSDCGVCMLRKPPAPVKRPPLARAPLLAEVGRLWYRAGVMRHPAIRFLLAAAVGIVLVGSAPAERDPAAPAEVRAAFGSGCEEAVIAAIRTARSEILVSAYVITRDSIVTALANEARRGLRVHLKYDSKQADFEGMKDSLAVLRKARVKCNGIRLSEEYASMHHKFVVVDRARVVTGSYNFTTSASERNYENVVVIESTTVAAAFSAEFEAMRSH